MNMFRSRILWKIYAAFVIVIIFAAVIVSVIAGGVIEDRTLDDVRQVLDVRTKLLTPLSRAILQGRRTAVDLSQIKNLGQEIHTRFTLIDISGKVLADSDKDPELMDNHRLRPEVQEAVYHNFGVTTRYSKTLKTRMMYLARAVRNQEKLLGFVRAALPLTLINRRISESRRMIIFGIGVIAMLALILGFLLARHFIHPLLQLTEMAESMAAGDFSLSLKSRRKDEIGRLVNAFNLMAAKSRARIETINSDRSKLNAILTGMREGVVAVDRDDVVIHINQAAAGMLQIMAENCVGRPIWEVLRLQELSAILKDVSSQGTDIKREMRISYGISEQVVEMHAVPLRAGIGEINGGAMVVLFDISELRRLETVRRDFVSNASHELKTPITAIRALVETLIDDSAGMSETVRTSFLDKIAQQSLRLSAIVVDLMALSRFEGPLEPQALSSQVDLRSVVGGAVECLRPLAEEKGISLEFRENDAELEIVSDAELIEQAVSNVLDNAIKYTAVGGRVAVAVRAAASEAVIEIKDSGIGISPQDKERIFERFYRVDKARSRELGGTGLGLAIVRHIVMIHKGRIEVDSQPGRGTAFRIILPLENDGVR